MFDRDEMIKQLRNLIKRMEMSGMWPSTVRASLLCSGWALEDVNEAYKEVPHG